MRKVKSDLSNSIFYKYGIVDDIYICKLYR